MPEELEDKVFLIHLHWFLVTVVVAFIRYGLDSVGAPPKSSTSKRSIRPQQSAILFPLSDLSLHGSSLPAGLKP